MKNNNQPFSHFNFRISMVILFIFIGGFGNPLQAQNECKKYLDDINKKEIPIPENKIVGYHICLKKIETFYADLKNPNFVSGSFPEEFKPVKTNILALRKDSVSIKGQVGYYTQKNTPDSIRYFNDKLKAIGQSLSENYMNFSKLSDNFRLTLKQSCQKLITYYDEKDNEIQKEEFISQLNKYQ